eukprot:TRINITY_DN4598_c1_g1_i2.p1 TRINITY_DN4598_c1_g1~~TRINITY_DN4598_c1_g1_i2.p1  ORF type:complete len:256 (-),score=14.90 TRINITY_DN4598_c1_g1_i2:268-1035(-)
MCHKPRTYCVQLSHIVLIAIIVNMYSIATEQIELETSSRSWQVAEDAMFPSDQSFDPWAPVVFSLVKEVHNCSDVAFNDDLPCDKILSDGLCPSFTQNGFCNVTCGICEAPNVCKDVQLNEQLTCDVVLAGDLCDALTQNGYCNQTCGVCESQLSTSSTLTPTPFPMPTPTPTPTATPEPNPVTTPTPSPTPAPAPVSTSSDNECTQTYTVKQDDLVFNIAMLHGLTLDEIVTLNPQIKNIDLIFPGQKINVGGC